MCINVCEDKSATGSGSGFLLRRRPEEGAVAQYQTQKHVSDFGVKICYAPKVKQTKSKCKKTCIYYFPHDFQISFELWFN